MAVKNYRTVLSLNPKHLGVLNNLAVIYTSKDQIEDAIKLFNKIIAMEPDNPVSYYNIACVYARQNKKDQSLKWLEKSIDKGFHNWELLKTDKDLENIRNTQYYEKLLIRHKDTEAQSDKGTKKENSFN